MAGFDVQLTGGVWGQVDNSTYLNFSGLTQEGWELTADQMPRDGHRTHTNLPDVVWDLNTSGITLRHESNLPIDRSLRILMGPPPPQWVRATETEVLNEAFGHRSFSRDWLTTTCSIGRVSARRRSDDWFEVRVVPPEGEPMREATTVCTAVARAFGFVLGRRCVIRGHQEINETSETRRLDTQYPATTRNSLLQPLGRQMEFMQNVERLLGLAIDFFLTELGERVVPYLYLCWDTADNSHLTRLAMSSICVEGLLRVAAETMGPTEPQLNPADLAAFQQWLSNSPSGFSQPFFNRLSGLAGLFRNLSANEIFRDWIARNILGMANEDFQAWRETRHPSAHGHLVAAGDPTELQTRVFRHARMQNLLNKVFLQLMGYTGVFIDYSRPGFPPGDFPAVSSDSRLAETPPAPQTPSASHSNGVRTQALPVQVEIGQLPDHFDGWAFVHQTWGPYHQVCPRWAQSVVEALQAQFPGATVSAQTVPSLSASTTVRAPELAPENQVDLVRQVVAQVEELVAQRLVGGTS